MTDIKFHWQLENYIWKFEQIIWNWDQEQGYVTNCVVIAWFNPSKKEVKG